MLSKKAQISIEVLVILSILVIGSVIFGVYYLNSLNKGINASSKLKVSLEELDSTVVVPGTSGGTTEPPINPPGDFQIDVSLNPDAPSQSNEQFDIMVKLLGLNNMSGNNINVNKIEVGKYVASGLENYQPTSDCNYISSNNVQINDGVLYNINVPIGSNVGDVANLTFSCSTDGDYKFTIYAKGLDVGNQLSEDFDDVNKEITTPIPPATMALDLQLEPTGQTPQGSVGVHMFGIKAIVTEYTGNDDIYIKKINVTKHNDNTPTNNCHYDDQPIPISGLPISKKMSKNGNIYELLLNQFSCQKADIYNITLTAGLLNDSSYDVNKTIEKRINSLNLYLTLEPPQITNINQNFGVWAKVNDYKSEDDLFITHIDVWKGSEGAGNSYNGSCYYNGSKIRKDRGLDVQIKLNRTGSDYNLLLDKFKCSTTSSDTDPFFIRLIVHDSSERSSNLYDQNNTIEKVISDPSLNFCNYVSGAGTKSDPYVILTATDLYCINYYLDKHFILGNNINLDHQTLSNDPSIEWWYDADIGWLPIGKDSEAAFTGSLEGNGYSINNLQSMLPANYQHNYFGLFAKGDGASFKNFSINYANITDNSLNVNYGGTLVGYLVHSTIEDVNITGNVTGKFAGLVDTIYDTNITNCSFSGGSVQDAVGGVGGTGIGKGEGRGGLINKVLDQLNERYLPSYITNSYFEGTFNSEYLSFSGGLIGDAQGAIIDGCYAKGTVSGKHDCLGGLVGGNPISVNDSYSWVAVSSTSGNSISYIGGLVGCSNIKDRGVISNSFFKGSINVSRIEVGSPNVYAVGGVAGIATSIINSYSEGIKFNVSAIGNMNSIGGLVGVLLNDSNNNYSRIPISTELGSSKNVGGLVGSATSKTNAYIKNCYSSKKIDARHPFVGTVGGLVGSKSSYVDVIDSFWKYFSDQYFDPNNGIGKEELESNMVYPYGDPPSSPYTSWDFDTVWMHDRTYNPDEIDSGVNDGYPYLQSIQYLND